MYYYLCVCWHCWCPLLMQCNACPPPSYHTLPHKHRVAKSKDLMTWTYRQTILPNADMPYTYTLGNDGWILLVHEQWMNKNSGHSSGP